MLELADIFREYGDAYRQKYAEGMLPSHKKAMWAIEQCRTPIMGGELFYCDACEIYHDSYHSCGNRHCPKCEGERSDRWREKQMEKLLPVPYFLVTFTLPHELNPLARSHQKLFYNLLFKSSAEALKTLGLNSKYVGGQIGMVGVLHTWDRRMGYHIHVHYLVPAGGIDLETGEWRPSHPKFLVPISAVRELFRAKFRDALKDTDLFTQVNPAVWRTHWVVHCKAVGDGRTALKYLAPYIYRVAISNRRLVGMQDGKVSFRYKPRKQSWKTMTLPALDFISRFLQHVLPRGFAKVRYYGFLHPSAKKRVAALREQLTTAAAQNSRDPAFQRVSDDTPFTKTPIVSPQCGGPLAYIGRVPSCPAPRGPSCAS